MKIGYARTSILSVEADFEPQLAELKEANCEKVFSEQVSTAGERKQLDAAMAAINQGDSLVVTCLDRLARSTAHLVHITDALGIKGASLHILDLAVDTATSKGQLMLKMMKAVAAFELEITAEKQREGIAKARSKGLYKGRKPTARAKTQEVLRLKDQGVGATEISKKLDIGRASVYRILKDRNTGRIQEPKRQLIDHPMKLMFETGQFATLTEIEAWAKRAQFASQKYGGYDGHVAMLDDLASVRDFVVQFVDDNGRLPKETHSVPKLKKRGILYGRSGKFKVQFPGD
jgi:DNA invertase Pin-like site-specific DNA recombinase